MLMRESQADAELGMQVVTKVLVHIYRDELYRPYNPESPAILLKIWKDMPASDPL